MIKRIKLSQYGGIGGGFSGPWSPAQSPLFGNQPHQNQFYDSNLTLDKLLSNHHHDEKDWESDDNFEKKLEDLHEFAEEDKIGYELSPEERLKLKMKNYLIQRIKNQRKEISEIENLPIEEPNTTLEERLINKRVNNKVDGVNSGDLHIRRMAQKKGDQRNPNVDQYNENTDPIKNLLYIGRNFDNSQGVADFGDNPWLFATEEKMDDTLPVTQKTTSQEGNGGYANSQEKKKSQYDNDYPNFGDDMSAFYSRIF